MQSAYKWTHEYILWHVTPAQLLVWSEEIRRRRAREQSDSLSLAVVSQAAVHGGKEAWGHYRRVQRDLREEAGEKPERFDGQAFARSLGLTPHERPGQPAKESADEASPRAEDALPGQGGQ